MIRSICNGGNNKFIKYHLCTIDNSSENRDDFLGGGPITRILSQAFPHHLHDLLVDLEVIALLLDGFLRNSPEILHFPHNFVRKSVLGSQQAPPAYFPILNPAIIGLPQRYQREDLQD